MTCVAFVPVRGGSKSIPLKNIKLFCGRPLLYWNLLELENTSTVDSVVVATDSDQIAMVANSFDFRKVTIYNRSAASATDTASTEQVMLEYLSSAGLSLEDTFVLVQITSPLTTRVDFSNAINQFHSTKSDSLLTCTRLKRFIWNQNGTPSNYNPNQRPRRQEFPGFLVENGAFYISTVSNIQSTKCRIGGKISVYEMADYTSVEIDEESDWIVAEGLMRKFNLKLHPTKEIKLVATDVDGVLTDAGMYYSERGDEMKKFNTKDGKGFELLRNEGIKTVIITSENTKLLERRGLKVKADYVVQGVTGIGKLHALTEICSSLSIQLSECAYMGDDINCVEILSKVGAPFCPVDAEEDVKQVANITMLRRRGGEGVFREMVSSIIKQRKV